MQDWFYVSRCSVPPHQTHTHPHPHTHTHTVQTNLRRRRRFLHWGWRCVGSGKTHWRPHRAPPGRADLHSWWGRYWRHAQHLHTHTHTYTQRGNTFITERYKHFVHRTDVAFQFSQFMFVWKQISNTKYIKMCIFSYYGGQEYSLQNNFNNNSIFSCDSVMMYSSTCCQPFL